MAWYTAPSLAQLRREVNARWPNRDKASDGSIGDAAHSSRVSDHNPNARGSVNALDFDEDGIDSWGLVAHLIKDPRVYYVIYERTIWQRKYNFVPRPYYGINAHDKHLHVSIFQVEWAEQDTRPWGIASMAPGRPDTSGPGLPGTGVNNTPDPLPTPAPDPLEEIMAMYASKEEFEQRQRDIVYSVLSEFTKHDYQRTIDRIKVGTREALELPVSKGRTDEWGATVLDSAARAAFRAGVVDGLSRELLVIVKEMAARSGIDVDEAAIAEHLAAAVAPVVREALAGEVADDVADRVVAKLGAALTQG